MRPVEQQVIDFFKRRKKRAFRRREIADQLGLRGGERKQLSKILQRLVRNGLLSEGKTGYRLAEPRKTLEGVFSLAERGYGFLRPDDQQREDLFIPARFVGSAMDGDRVLVSRHVSPRDGRHSGRVLKVLQRAHRTLIGHYRMSGRQALVWPLDRKLGGPVQVTGGSDLSSGDVVAVSVTEFARGSQPASGRISERLGRSDDPQVDILTVIRGHDLAEHFSAEALQQAQSIPTRVSTDEIPRRVDLRSLPLVTIDGETARDFDDAVAVRKQADGRFRLWVCIADVAHYIEAGCPIDRDARERGTSVYFPGFCLPMLPEVLSNGICSLNPHEDRLVMAAELLIDGQGVTCESRFYPALMHSQARLTYTKVASILAGSGLPGMDEELVSQLREMHELASILSAMRQRRGSLELDVPEVEVRLDASGRPIDLVRSERNQAHRIIEEFMLAANEAVASFLREHGWNFLYRIHQEPDPTKLEELQQLAAHCGFGLTLGRHLQQSLQELLHESAGRAAGRLLHEKVLRSLQQACYSPHNSGHFGLAAECYCHFTSPIRRYPDLLVHRILKLALDDRPKSESLSLPDMETLGRECSARERQAVEAERDLIDLRCCQVMAGRIGEEFDGVISSVTEFGFFVELDRVFVTGLVHIRTLPDYFHFDPVAMTLTGERRHQVYQAGIQVRVRLHKVETWRRRIDFELV